MHYLEGLRGLSALYVLLHHEKAVDLSGGGVSRYIGSIQRALDFGHFAVVVFIVLSGYSLMLPIARSGDTGLVGGIRRYFYRRARRILPPYYAALILSLGVILALRASDINIAFRSGSLISHTLLIHNLCFGWQGTINAPMWSVATEWQIYFLFPLLLLPMWRRIDLGLTVAIAWIIGSAPNLLIPPERNLFWACPWFLGSFALGMAGAVIGFSKNHRYYPLFQRLPWTGIAIVSMALIVRYRLRAFTWIVVDGSLVNYRGPAMDLLVSVVAFCLINACTRDLVTGKAARPISRLLSSKPLAQLGGFSYSLYLIQDPLLRLVDRAMRGIVLSPDLTVCFKLVVCTPVILAFAWLFAQAFEKPFLRAASVPRTQIVTSVGT